MNRHCEETVFVRLRTGPLHCEIELVAGGDKPVEFDRGLKIAGVITTEVASTLINDPTMTVTIFQIEIHRDTIVWPPSHPAANEIGPVAQILLLGTKID